MRSLPSALGLTILWQVRNKVDTGYSGFSGISSINLYFDSAASVLAAKQHVPWREMQNRLGYQDKRIYFKLHPEQKAWPLAQRLDFMSHQAGRILLWAALLHTAGSILRAFFDLSLTLALLSSSSFSICTRNGVAFWGRWSTRVRSKRWKVYSLLVRWSFGVT